MKVQWQVNRRWRHGQRLVAGYEPHRWLINRIKAPATINTDQVFGTYSGI
jgi:hypothetical protein